MSYFESILQSIKTRWYQMTLRNWDDATPESSNTKAIYLALKHLNSRLEFLELEYLKRGS